MPTPVVTFNYATWIATFPDFAACSAAQGQAWFNLADLYFANDPCNPAIVLGEARFGLLLYLMTSHIAWLNAPRDANGNPAETGQPASTLVGRLSSVSEGSVSASTEWNSSGSSPGESWYLQSKWGAEFWLATAQFRTARYAAQPTVIAGGIFPYYPGVRSFRRY